MDLLSGYSGSESDPCRSSKEKEANSSSSNDDSGSESTDNSVDSATLRAAEAEARLRDYETVASGKGSVLPSAALAFEEVDGPPAFLNPEATRKLAMSAQHGRAEADTPASTDADASWHGPRGKVPPGQKFDISRLAPPLKGQPRSGTDKRGIPYSAVIEGKAKRLKADEGAEATQQYSSAQVAMLGGNVHDRGAGTRAMPVSDFLDKGLGAAQLPRKAQDRKDKEKTKRSLGQSSINSWKSEAEMVLRQQYD